MRRRRFLAGLPAALAGCGEAAEGLDPRRTPGDGRTPGAAAARAGTDDTGEANGTDGGPAERRSRTRPARSFDVIVANDGPRRRLVTVVVETADDGTAFVTTRTVESGAAASFDGVVGPGRYRVVVETATGDRVERGWHARDPFRELEVRVDEALAVRRVARCAPDCSPLSRGGEATGYPPAAFDRRGRRAGTALRLVNDAGAARRAAVRVEGLLDYAYQVPAGAVLEVPVPQRSGARTVRVATRSGTVSHRWRMESTPTLRVRVDDRPAVSCGPGSLDLRCLNDDDRPRELSVRVVADGVDEYGLALDPGESVRLRDVVRTAGSYALVLETTTATTGFRWTTCPARGPVEVVVRPGGVPVAPSLPRTSSGAPR